VSRAALPSRFFTPHPSILTFSYDADTWEQAMEPLHRDPPIVRSEGVIGSGLAPTFAATLLEQKLVTKVRTLSHYFAGHISPYFH
jgi:hypothetical protein